MRTRIGATLGVLGLSAAALTASLGGQNAQAGTMATLTNGTFTSGTSGWTQTAALGKLALTSAGHTGNGAKLTHTSSSPYSVIMDDSPNTVSSTIAWSSYTATAWVRPSSTITVEIRLSERSGATDIKDTTSTNTVQAGTWTEIGVTTVPQNSGHALSLSIIGSALPAGGSLIVDDVSFAARHSAWGDEFSNSSLNRTVWAPLNNSRQGAGNDEQSCYMDRPANLVQWNGTVQLIGRRENTPLYCGWTWPENRYYSSGFLTTQGKMSWTYGRFEVRAKLPTGQTNSAGLWTAMWLWPDDTGPGEIDIMEAIGTDATHPTEYKKTYQYIHYDANESKPQQGQSYTFPSGTYPSDGFHTYVMEWNPTNIRWFVDSKMVYTRDASTTPWLASTMNRPMHLNLNLTVGANWPGQPTSSTAFPAVFDIDYVRTYSPAVN